MDPEDPDVVFSSKGGVLKGVILGGEYQWVNQAAKELTGEYGGRGDSGDVDLGLHGAVGRATVSLSSVDRFYFFHFE